jgi:hypothetical protein
MTGIITAKQIGDDIAQAWGNLSYIRLSESALIR